MFQIKTIRASVYLLLCILVVSCAQIVAPGGGKKDVRPPKVLSYSPDSAQLNFNSRTIEIKFDEFIQLKDLNNQLIISPPFQKPPDISVQKKSLLIALDKDEQLNANTTYSISFGNAIQDLNENNPIENFKYIFSTGNFIDSLVLKGKVHNAFDNTTEKGIVVMLYSNFDDSVVYKKLPSYFSKTNADGTFQINNIRAGKYKLVALKDANANYKYDGEAESIGFVNEAIDVSAKNNILIDLFQEPAKKVYLKKYINDYYGKFTLVFNQGSDSINVKPLGKNANEIQAINSFSKNKDTLIYWVKNLEKDSLILQVNNGNKIIDTIAFKVIKKETALKSSRNPLKLKLVNSPNGNQGFDLNAELNLNFSQPIAILNRGASIQLKEDSALSKTEYTHLGFNPRFQLDPQHLTLGFWDSTMQVEYPNKSGKFVPSPMFSFKLPLKENTHYHLFIPPGTFTDIFGLTNDSIKIDFKTRELKFYGNVKLNLTIPETKGHYIVQLLDEKENIIREDYYIKQSEILTYDYLYPQKYKLKIIYDDNTNEKWDTGNYQKKIQPEKTIYNKELINIRSNWDAELDWKVTNNE
jgi:uncharacterized protein (DUF2141 family)